MNLEKPPKVVAKSLKMFISMEIEGVMIKALDNFLIVAWTN